MDKISYLINDILAMNKDQLLKFKKYMNYLDSNYNINNYYELDYRQFSLVSCDCEEFRFYRDGDNKLSCEYIIYDEIGINNLSNLIYCFKDKDILITSDNNILLLDIENKEDDDELDLSVIDCLEYLLINNDLNNINLDCNEETKARYFNYLDYFKNNNYWSKK